MRRFLPTVVLLLCGCILVPVARAQESPRATEAPDTSAHVETAHAALIDGDAEKAIRLLQPVVDEAPAYMHPQWGAAAYWLAEAYAAAEQPQQALQVSRTGLDALRAANAFSMPLADAYIHHALRHGTVDDLAGAAEAYLQLIERAGTVTGERDQAVMARHLRQVAVVLPKDLQARTGLTVGPMLDMELEPTENAGTLIANWWRGQDVLPASAENERLEEHLRRIAHAEQTYSEDGALDDRGLIYVRLGTPYETTEVDFDNEHFRDKVLRRNLTLSRFDFPDNVFWSYDHLDKSAYYLFVEKNGRYELSDTKSLFPSFMRHGLSTYGRGYRKAYSLVHTMELVYRQLGMYHEEYMQRYADATDAAAVLDMREFAGSAVTLERQSASDFGSTMLSDIEVQDQQHQATRDEQVPPSYSELLEDTDPLPVHVRHARFLEEDGTTRTEFYWSAGIQALLPADTSQGTAMDDYMVVTSSTHRAENYEARASKKERQVIQPRQYNVNGVLAPRTHTVRGDTGLYHLAMQWDEYRMTGPTRQQMGPLLKRNVYRADSLRALEPAPGELVMSDLKPLTVPSDRARRTAFRLDDTVPYPFTALAPRTPLALYFEVYNLVFGAEDRTRYTVEYEVRRWQEERGVWKRITGDDDLQVTTTQTTYTGSSRRTEEYIFLDQSQWGADSAGDQDRLEIVVRVTDENTGRATQRSIRFETAPDADYGS